MTGRKRTPTKRAQPARKPRPAAPADPAPEPQPRQVQGVRRRVKRDRRQRFRDQ